MSSSTAILQSGILSIDKPRDVTSRQVVNRVAARRRPLRAGHAGTLDPLATGVLLVGIGQGTRLIADLQQFSKTYRATFVFGQSSDSEDVEGALTAHPADPIPSIAELRAACATWTGCILQRPPRYSALKVAGRRAYDRARAGESFELPSRPVQIDRIGLLRYEYPELELEVACGSGTYIRSLGRDLAETCGAHAVMSQLRRTSIGPFEVDSAVPWTDLIDPAADLSGRVEPLGRAVGDRPAVCLDESTLRQLSFGQSIQLVAPLAQERLFVFDAEQRLRGEIEWRADERWYPRRMFPLDPVAASR